MTTHIMSVSGLSLEDFDYVHFYERYITRKLDEEKNAVIYGSTNISLSDGVNPVPQTVFTFEASI